MHPYLINSIVHLSNHSSIDTRTYFGTIHVRSYHDLERIRKIVYLYLNELVTSSRYGFSDDQPSLIIGDDVEGSRDNNPVVVNPLYPHYHFLLIMPEGYDCSMVSEVLNRISEVVSVDIRKYDYSKSIDRMISYIMKMSNYDGYDFAVYPYEFSVDILAASLLEKRCIDDPSIIFSKKYLDKYY